MKVWIVYEHAIDWDWNVQKVFDSKEKAEKWRKENQINHNIDLDIEEVEVE